MTLSCPLACDKCDQLDSLIKLSSCYDHREDCSSHVTTHKGCEKYPEYVIIDYFSNLLTKFLKN